MIQNKLFRDCLAAIPAEQKAEFDLSVYHQYSVPTIFQVVTPISFLKKVILVSFLG